jgi:aspartyl-tRNA(Asn)/glutamyl-tRNA(Gln) amidotransferase subunit A
MFETLHDLAALLRSGRVSARELTETALDRCTDPQGEGARTCTRVYADSARAQADAADALRGAGLARSLIDGLPISIKDLFDVAGETTLAGSVALREAPPAQATAEVVRRLRAAGAVIVGRTNMTEFAYSGLGINPHYGTPRNPWDRATGRIPGGSSSGAAVSVSDGMAVAGIGTDTGGSVRIPAALCGLAGFKPTASRVPRDGVLPLSTSLDSVGPIARTLRCCAVMDAIMAGAAADGDAIPQPARLRGLRLAVPLTVAMDDIDEHVGRSFAAALRKLAEAGAAVEEIALPEFAQLASINAGGGLAAPEAWAWHRGWVERVGERYDPRVLSRILRGAEMSASDYVEVLAARRAWCGAVARRIEPYDALVLPTVPIVAPAIEATAATDAAYASANALVLRNPTLINFLDGCAASIPCQEPGTAPAGLMIAGPAGSDRRILAIGMALEAVL